MASVACEPYLEGCTTEYGVSTDTFCIGDDTGATYCLEWCTLSPTGCDDAHACVPLETGSGVCWPMW